MAGQVVTGDLITATWLNEVERRKPTKATVATSQTTTSGSYVDLATTGPAVTVTTGVSASVDITAQLVNSGASFSFVGIAVSGATTIAAPAVNGEFLSEGTNDIQATRRVLVTGLTAGSNTFTLKYKVSGGTGTFLQREIIVIPQD